MVPRFGHLPVAGHVNCRVVGYVFTMELDPAHLSPASFSRSDLLGSAREDA